MDMKMSVPVFESEFLWEKKQNQYLKLSLECYMLRIQLVKSDRDGKIIEQMEFFLQTTYF